MKQFLHLTLLLSVFILISDNWAQPPSPAGGGWLTLKPGTFATAADNPSLDTGFQKGFTIEFWMYLKRLPQAKEQWPIISKPGSYAIWLEGNELGFNENTVLVSWYMSDTTGGVFISGVGFQREPDEATERWVHIVFQVKDSRYWSYFNGELREWGEIGVPKAFIVPKNTDSPFFINFSCTIGTHQAPYQIKPFEGIIDEVRISSVKRYEGEDIKAQIHQRFQPDVHTVALWHFGEEANARLYRDASRNENTLRLMDIAAVEPNAKLATTWGAMKSR
ncbi:hypothetical protein HYR99_04940 [Candidatus Poribacteria bacterium]|nr:hypothetical protein [Candidatus Poribacteria bacterium]